MKKLIISFAVLVGVLTLASIGLIYNAETLAMKYKPEIEQALGKTLKSKVTLGNITVRLFPSVRLALDHIMLSQPKRSGSGLKLNNAALKLKLLPLISGMLVIEELILTAPIVELLKTSVGIEIVGLGPKSKDKLVAGQQKKSSVENDKSISSASTASIALDAFSINSGELIFKDQAAKSSYTIKPLNVQASLKMSNNTVEIPTQTVDSSITGSAPNLKVTGQIKQTGSGSINAKGDFDTQGLLSLGNFNIELPNLALSDLSSSIKYTATKTNFNLVGIETTLKINNQAWQGAWSAEKANTVVKLHDAKFRGCSGTIELDASSKLGSDQSFDLAIKLRALNMAELLPSLLPKLALTITGTLVDSDLKVSGNLSNDIISSINGTGQANLNQITIKNLNIAGRALDSVSNIPFLKASLLSEIPEQYRSVFESPDTVVDSISLNYSIQNKTLSIKKLFMQSKLYDITASGTANFQNQVNLKTEIAFAPELSSQMVSKTKELKYLIDSSGKLILPLEISGTIPNILITPHLDKLLESQVGSIINEKAGDTIKQLLGSVFK